jgi:hypothetical protein
MIRFHDDYPHFPVKWVPAVPGQRNDNLPGPWPDASKGGVPQTATPWIVNPNG